MPSESKVYIAGVGVSPASKGASVDTTSLITAATKALLDAGVTYDDVSRGVISKSQNRGANVFRAFDDGNGPVEEVEDGAELDKSYHLVRDRGEQCVLMVAIEEVRRETFFWSKRQL